MNSTTQIDALVHSEKVRPKPAKKKKVDTPLSYRLMVLYRFALALLGGYLLAALSALTIAKVFIANPVNAAMSARVTVVLPAPLWVPAMTRRGRDITVRRSSLPHDFPPNVTRTPPKIERIGVPALATSSYFSSNKFSARR